MEERELAKIGMEVALRPLTEIAENALGRLGGDWLSEQRVRNRARLRKRTEEVLSERGADIDEDVSPSIAMPLLSAAQDEGRDELTDLWARLLAAAMDPENRPTYRREFVEIAKQLEAIDGEVCKLIPNTNRDASRPVSRQIAEKLGLDVDQVAAAMRTLKRVELTTSNHGDEPNPFMTALGRQFLAVVG